MQASLILIRHGKSVWNAQNRFTGWVDVPLALDGWDEAARAGQLLAERAFDVAFTSHLQRAITTLRSSCARTAAAERPFSSPQKARCPASPTSLPPRSFQFTCM